MHSMHCAQSQIFSDSWFCLNPYRNFRNPTFYERIANRLGLNEFLWDFLVKLHRDSGLFLQSFGYFQEGLFNETPLKISRSAHSILACLLFSAFQKMTFWFYFFCSFVRSVILVSRPFFVPHHRWHLQTQVHSVDSSDWRPSSFPGMPFQFLCQSVPSTVFQPCSHDR